MALKGSVRIESGTVPDTPPAGDVTIYIDEADLHAKQVNENGTVIDLTANSTNTGWELYEDTQYTEISPFEIDEGVAVALPNNGLSSDVSQAPTVNALYDGTRMTPNDLGDSYVLRISIAVATTSNNGTFSLSLDISALGDGSITIASTAIRTARGTGINNAQLYSIAIPIFTLGTFMANGGLFRFESITGDSSLYDISFLIQKTHKGV